MHQLRLELRFNRCRYRQVRLRQHRRQQQEFHRHLRFERPARRHEQQRGRPDLRVESRRYRGIVPGAGEEDKLIIRRASPAQGGIARICRREGAAEKNDTAKFDWRGVKRQVRTDSAGEVRAFPSVSFQTHCKFNSNSYSGNLRQCPGAVGSIFPFRSGE